MDALWFKFPDIAKYLLDQGAGPNLVIPCGVSLKELDRNFQGATNGYMPLHDSLWHGCENCARILIELRARLDLVGHDGKTPADLAQEVLRSATNSPTGSVGRGCDDAVLRPD